VASRLIPRPDTASGDLRFVSILRLLARQTAVDFCCEEEPPSPNAPEEHYLERLEADGIGIIGCGTEAYSKAVQSRAYSCLFVEFWTHARLTVPYMRRVQPWASIVVDSVDVHFLREAAAARLGLLDEQGVAERKARELSVYRLADEVIVVSAEDEASLRAEGGVDRIRRIPNVTVPRARSLHTRDPILVFVGGFQHLPNRDAAIWLVEEILPRVREAVPAATVRIVGHSPPPDVVALGNRAGVEVVGFVPDVGPYLDTAAVSVAPLRYGAGMKGKVTQAMAAGTPVVATSFGAEGLGAEAGRHLVVADSAVDFSNAVIRCLRDPQWAAQIGLEGQRHIEGVCGESAVARALEKLVAERALIVPWYAGVGLSAYRTARRVAKTVGLKP